MFQVDPLEKLQSPRELVPVLVGRVSLYCLFAVKDRQVMAERAPPSQRPLLSPHEVQCSAVPCSAVLCSAGPLSSASKAEKQGGAVVEAPAGARARSRTPCR